MTRGIITSTDLDDEWLHEHLFGGACRTYDIALLDWLDEDEERDSADSPEFTSGAIYLGDWITENGYPKQPKKDGPTGFAAIYSRSSGSVTVSWSRWVQQGVFDCLTDDAWLIRANGDVSAYSLPTEAFREDSLQEWGGEILEVSLCGQ